MQQLVDQAFLSASAPQFSQVSGDGDAFIEPNETWAVDMVLTNSGGASASSIVGTLSSNSANVTVLSSQSTYPNLGPGDSSNNLLLSFRVEPAYLCGARLALGGPAVPFTGPAAAVLVTDLT